MLSSLRLFMGRTMMALRSYRYATNRYWFPLKDITENLPVRSVYIVPSLESARVAKQNMSIVEQTCWAGCMSSTCSRASFMPSDWFLVERIPWRMHLMCPLSVADDGGRWRSIRSLVNPGKVRNCSLSIALTSVGFGGDRRDW